MDEQLLGFIPFRCGLIRQKHGHWPTNWGYWELIRTDTLTCYNGVQGDGCGHCPACTLRREGLEKYLKSKNQ